MLVMCVDRRVVWLLLILLSFSVFAYMTSTKLVYLLSYPKNVDLNVEFKPTLEFPSVTICNNNYFRYTFFVTHYLSVPFLLPHDTLRICVVETAEWIDLIFDTAVM